MGLFDRDDSGRTARDGDAPKRRSPEPGKYAGTDNYGAGGPDLIPPVPGKRSGTDQLDASAGAAARPSMHAPGVGKYALSAYGAGDPAPATSTGAGGRTQAPRALRENFEIQAWSAGASEPPMRVGTPASGDQTSIAVQATGVSANATVRALTPEAQEYSVGYVQTIHSSRRQAIYESEPGVVAATWLETRGTMLDQRTDLGSPTPWYNYGLSLGTAPRSPGMTDNPVIVVPEYSEEFALLARLEGQESFTTYLVAMVGNDSSTIVYLGNVHWSVAWTGRFNESYTSFSGGRGTVGAATRSADGGAVLSGPAANEGTPGTFTTGSGGSTRGAHGAGTEGAYGADAETLARLRAAVNPAWAAVLAMVPADGSGATPATLGPFRQAAYRLVLDRQPGVDSLGAYLNADPAFAAWKTACDEVTAAVVTDRDPITQITAAIAQLAGGMLERDVHSAVLSGYVRLSTIGRRYLRDQSIVTGLADGPVKQLLRGESPLLPLLAPDAQPAGTAGTPPTTDADRALDDAFTGLRTRILAEDPAVQDAAAHTRRDRLSTDIRNADGRVLDRLRADTEVSVRIAALTQHYTPTQGDDSGMGADQQYTLDLGRDADSVSQLYGRVMSLDENARFAAIRTYLEQRPGVANQPVRARVMQNQELMGVITGMTDDHQRQISRLIATGTTVAGPLDHLHDAAAGQGSAEDALRAAIEFSRDPQFPLLRGDGLFRQTIESGLNRNVATVAGLTLSVHDFVLRMWGETPNGTGDAESALPQDAVNPTQDPAPRPDEMAVINALFPPVVEGLASELDRWWIRDEQIRSILVVFETHCADPTNRRIFERARMHPGVELQRRCNADSRIGDIRNQLQRYVGEEARQVAERVLGIRVDAATMGRIDGRVQLADQAAPLASGTVPLAQALRSLQVNSTASWAIGGTLSVSQFVHNAAAAMRDKLMEWHLWGGCAGNDITTIWNGYVAAFRANAIGADPQPAAAGAAPTAATVQSELQRMTGIGQLHPIELLVNAYHELPDGGGDLAGTINSRVNSGERTTVLRSLGLDADSVAARNRVPTPAPPSQLEREANDFHTALLASQRMIGDDAGHDNVSEPAMRHAGEVWARVRGLDAAAQPAGTATTATATTATATGSAPGTPPTATAAPDTFHGTYRRLFGIEPQRHIVEIGRRAVADVVSHAQQGQGESDDSRGRSTLVQTTTERIAQWLGLTVDQIRAEVRAPAAALPEATASGFSRAQAQDSARRIWEGLRRGDVVALRHELEGRRAEERDLINRCFNELSGGIDIQFYVQQALAATTADPTSSGRLLLVGGEGVHDQGDASIFNSLGTPYDAQSWQEASDVVRTGAVGILTRVRTALANSDRNEIFRVADEATPDERRAILGDEGTMGSLRSSLRPVDYDRVFAVLTGTADMAVRLYSRSQGDVSGSVTRFFTDTDTEGMRRDIRDYGRRRREVHTRELEDQGLRADDPAAQQRVQDAVRADLLRTYDNPQVRAVIDQEFPSWSSGTDMHQTDSTGRDIEGRLLAAGETDGMAALRTDGHSSSSDMLAQVRQWSPDQRALHRADPEFMRRVWDRSIDILNRRLILLALQSEEPAGEDHILRIVELGSGGDGTILRQQVARLTERELRRLRSEPDLVATINEHLNGDEQTRFLALLALDTAGSARLLGATAMPAAAPQAGDAQAQTGTSPQAPSPAQPGDATQAAQRVPQFFSLGTREHPVPGRIDDTEVQRLGLLRAQCTQRLILGANNSWINMLREAVEVFRADLRPRLQPLEAPAPATGDAQPPRVDLTAPAREYEIHTLREQIWNEVQPAIHRAIPLWGTSATESTVRDAVMKTADPSDQILRDDLHWCGNEGEDIQATIRAASPEHIINHWSSVKQVKFAGAGGEPMQVVYDNYKAARQAAQSNPTAANTAEMQRWQQTFARYVVEPSYEFEGILLPHTGGLTADRDRTTHARQQLDRNNPHWAQYRQELQERIRGLDGGQVAAAIGATGADADLVSGRLRSALTDFNVAEELYAYHRGDGQGIFAQDEGRQLDRSFGDYRRELTSAEDQATAHGGDIDDRERRELQHRDETMRERAADYSAAREAAASIAANIVGTVVSVFAIALTAGAATPLAMAAYGALTAAAAATGEVLTREMVQGRTYDASGDGLREIAGAAAEGFIAAGAQYYAGRLTSGLLRTAASEAEQGRMITEMAAQHPPRWQRMLHAGGRTLVQESMTGLVHTAGSALSPTVWSHGWDEGWIRASQQGRESIRSRPLQVMRATITAMIGASVGSPDTVGESVRPGERIGLDRTLRQIGSDMPGNLATAGADTAIGVATGEVTTLPGAAGHLASGVSGGVRQTGSGLEEGSVHRQQAADFVRAQIAEHPHLFVGEHERALYERAVEASLAQGEPPTAVEFSAARDAFARARQSVPFSQLSPAEQDEFNHWVRSAPTTEEFRARMDRNPFEALAEIHGTSRTPRSTGATGATTEPPVQRVEAARTELRQLHDRSVATETPTADAAISRVAQARADIERANTLEADARQSAQAAHAQVETARAQGAPNVAALEADAARADTALQEILSMAALVRLSAQVTIRNASDAGHVRSLPTLQPGDPPPADATPAQREAILEANRRFRALGNPRDARYVHAETPRLAWVEYLRQHGIDVPNATTVDLAHDLAGPSGGSIREQTTHPLDHGRQQVSERIAPSTESVIRADGDAAHPGVAREFHDGARAPNVGGVSRQQAHAALAELVRTGAIPNVQPGSTGSTVSVRVGEGASARTIRIEVLTPSDTHGAIAQSDFGAHPDHIHVWISDRILDEHVPRALGGIIADVIARASGRTGSAAEAAGRQGQLRAMFAHLQALEAAPPPAASSDAAATSRVQGRAESVARIRAEIDLMLADMNIAPGDTAARRTALDAIQDPELRRLVDAHIGRGQAIGFNPEAAAQARTDAQRRAPEATATDQAAASGQVSASAVLPPPPTGDIHGFSAADYPRVVELRMHLEAIREMDARLAARDQSGAARDAALGESLRRREHVDRVRALLGELQIGGTNQEFIRQRLAELNAVFPGTADISQAVEQRVQRRLSAVSAHQRAEAFRQARAAAAQQLADSIVSGPRPYTTERAIVGGGMAGTSRAAAVGSTVGADGHVDPHQLLVLGGDDMISGWAPDEHWGQRMGVFENSDHPMFSGATEGNHLGDVVEDPGEFMHVGELNDAMDLARQRLGLVPVPGRVLQVEVAPAGQATWTAEGGATVDATRFPVRMRVLINGTEVTIYTAHSDITTGLGNTGLPNEGILDPASRDQLLAASPGSVPIVMGGERMMARDAPRMTGRVLVVAFGPTGAWAAYRAAELGATAVDWGGTGTVDGNTAALHTAASIDRTQETFAQGDVQARIHRTTDQIVSIEHDGGSGAIVTYAYPDSTPERPHVYRVRYDHVLMTQGFDSAGGSGATAPGRDAPSAATPTGDARVGSMIGGMHMQVQSGTDAPNLENSGAHAGAVTVYGGAAWDGAGLQTDAQRAELRERQQAAGRANSADSPDARTMEAMGRAVSATPQ